MQSLAKYASTKIPEAISRQALRAVLQGDKPAYSYAHPYHWAALVYTGV